MVLLQGQTLGQRHKYYNQLVKEALAEKREVTSINYDESDVTNMINIDLACKYRNVDFILQVLQCDDMAYISRVLKHSLWLITDPQYANIINPSHLHRHLFPHMNAKAVNKLLLYIRVHLKSESRVKDFYWYSYNKNQKASASWLQNCSLKFMECRFEKHAGSVTGKLALRLCRKSYKVLVLYTRQHWLNSEFYTKAKFFLKTRTEEFLDRLEKDFDGRINFSKKDTQLLLKKCPQRIMENYPTYSGRLNFNLFLKFLKEDQVIPFIIKTCKKNRNWFSYYNLWEFLHHLPPENVLGLLKTLLAIRNGTWTEPDESKEAPQVAADTLSSDKSESSKNEDDEERGDIEALFYEIERGTTTFSDIYRWYSYIPFELGFPDIKKFIFAESCAEERHALLITMLDCSNYDFQHVKTVIKYYHDKHINEPYYRKITFVNAVISQQATYKFDEADWKLLNDLYQSLEVYIESTNKVQECLKSIILYSLLHDQPVHEVVEKKFEFETLKNYRGSLNQEEQDKVFTYLYNYLLRNLQSQNTQSETGFCEAIRFVKHIWNLLNDWQRQDSLYQFVIDKISELGEIHRNSPWKQAIRNRYRRLKRNQYWEMPQKTETDPSAELASIYLMVKPYKRALFEHSIILNASDDVFLNALKHDPQLLVRYKNEVEYLRLDNRTSTQRFFKKIRMYWPESLRTEWVNTNLEHVDKLRGHKTLIRGIMTLLSYKELLDYIKKYAPNENKIDWNDGNEAEKSIRKHIAKSMHLARPHLPIEMLLWYVKGDYLQFSLRSLLTAYHTLRSSDMRKYIEILLDTPVSIQKHGIRLAFAKYKTEELIEKSKILWSKTKNSSLRNLLFTLTFDLLCKEKNNERIKEIWSVLNSFIDDLKKDENNTIYNTLGRVRDVPLLVIGEFYPKAYLFLKTLPSNYEMENLIKSVVSYAENIIEYLDNDFVEDHLLHSVLSIILGKDPMYMSLLAAYLMCSKDLEIQMKKFNKLLLPVLEKDIPKLNIGEFKRNGLHELLSKFCGNLSHYVFNKNMVMPLEMLKVIRDTVINGKLGKNEVYAVLVRWELTVAYMEIVDLMRTASPDKTWEQIRSESLESFTKVCLKTIIEDVQQFFPSVYLIFGDVISKICTDFNIKDNEFLNVLDYLLIHSSNEIVYMLVLNKLPYSKNESKLDAIRSKLYCHPSKELNFHYVQWYKKKYTEVIYV